MVDFERERQFVRRVDFFPPKEVLVQRLEASGYQDEILDFLRRKNVPLGVLFTWSSEKSLLPDIAILRHFLAGNIVIDPFRIDQLTPNSYDVRLGRHFYRQNSQIDLPILYASPRHRLRRLRAEVVSRDVKDIARQSIFNPFDPLNTEFVWRQVQPEKAKEFQLEHGVSLEGIDDEDEIIMLGPHEQVLAHTEEFIGGRNVVSTMISARSSIGRAGIEVCNDANLGHIGFTNRWTLEIRNKSNEHAVPLVVGQRCAQVTFIQTGPSAQSYQGSYQEGFDVKEVKRAWRPEMMLPRMRRR